MATHSLRKSIDNMCKRCLYDPVGGTGPWRMQVQACTAYDCPLWPVRPRGKPRKAVFSASKADTGLPHPYLPGGRVVGANDAVEPQRLASGGCGNAIDN
jgi:hypothetical protein